VVVGLTKNHVGRWQRVLGIGDGPTTVLTADLLSELALSFDLSAMDLQRAEGGR
jgi:hypothetical protein